MRNFLFLSLILLLFSCNKEEEISLEKQTLGKWGVYEEDDTTNQRAVGGFDFKSSGKLYIYPNADFTQGEGVEFSWSVNANSEIIIVLQGNQNPNLFPNATQDDPITISFQKWNQGDPIMAIKIFNKVYRMVKME